MLLSFYFKDKYTNKIGKRKEKVFASEGFKENISFRICIKYVVLTLI
jgi:hypothetical protein